MQNGLNDIENDILALAANERELAEMLAPFAPALPEHPLGSLDVEVGHVTSELRVRIAQHDRVASRVFRD